MATRRRARSIAWIGVSVVALAGAGCCAPLDLVAGWRAATQPAAPTSGPMANNAPPPNKLAGPPPANHGPAPNQPEAPPGAAACPPHSPEPVGAAHYETPSHVLATFSQKLAAADDERKILIARLQQLEVTLEARDQALAASVHEVTAAQADIATTRADMERWKQEMLKLRDKARTIEKENLQTLQSIINMLEQVAETEPEAGPAGKPTPPPSRPPERPAHRP